MKKLTIALLMATALTFSGCNTSDKDDDIISGSNLTEQELANEPVFTVVDQQPEFPGGVQAMYRFLGENVRYPAEASKNKIQGKVFLTFVIGSNGKVRNVEVLQGVHSSLDTEATRVVNTMPKWIPGKKDGKKVAVRYNLPISFKLE